MSRTNATRRGRIETYHRTACRTRRGGRCNCHPSYRARVTDPRTGERHWSETGHDYAVAESWLADALRALDAGVVPGGNSRTTVAEHLDELIERMRGGRALTRSGEHYRPSTIRSYGQAADKWIKPQLGHLRLTKVRRRDVQDLIDHMRVKGLSGSTIHNKLDPLRVVFRIALNREEVTADPCSNLQLPVVRPKPRRVADPARAEALLDALPDSERAAWAALFYGGLRVGEARALRCSDLGDELQVSRGWDDVEGELDDPKTEAGKRAIPLTGRLRAELRRHLLASGRRGDDLVFGRTATEAFDRATFRRRARKAWKAAGLDPLTPHECRHTCASYLVAAGVNDMQLTRYIGHTDVRTTKNIYGHLFPDDAQQVAAQLDTYLGDSRWSEIGP